jgi:hypothetical protein
MLNSVLWLKTAFFQHDDKPVMLLNSCPRCTDNRKFVNNMEEKDKWQTDVE